jgi:uncharacterized protein DUF3300
MLAIAHTPARCPRSGLGTQIVVCLLSSAFLLAIWPKTLCADQDAQAPQAPPYSQETPDQLQQLVAPIALYPDSLVAQILAASTFPEQVNTNTTTRSTRSMPRPSSAMKGNITVFIGRCPPASLRVPSDRWWRALSLKAMLPGEAALRLLIGVTTFISSRCRENMPRAAQSSTS